MGSHFLAVTPCRRARSPPPDQLSLVSPFPRFGLGFIIFQPFPLGLVDILRIQDSAAGLNTMNKNASTTIETVCAQADAKEHTEDQADEFDASNSLEEFIRIHRKLSLITDNSLLLQTLQQTSTNVRFMTANGSISSEMTEDRIANMFAEPECEEDEVELIQEERKEEEEEEVEEEEEERARQMLLMRWRRVSVY